MPSSSSSQVILGSVLKHDSREHSVLTLPESIEVNELSVCCDCSRATSVPSTHTEKKREEGEKKSQIVNVFSARDPLLLYDTRSQHQIMIRQYLVLFG